MPRQIITTADAPSSPLYSQAVKAGPHVLISGMAGIDPGSGSLAGDTIRDQTRKALANCQAILQASGASLDDVIEVEILLTNPADFADLNEEYAVVPVRATGPLRRQARRRTARTAGLDPDDGIHRPTWHVVVVRQPAASPVRQR